ncbi:MAG: PDZ domain-containing protein, partial [Halioglobus sp.]|nr:PDZ domain-containing protein [Halioglobus sp.]
MSDREQGRFGIYHYDPASTLIERVSGEPDWDVLSLAADGNTLVYAAGGRLKEHDLRSNRTREIVIHIDPDLPGLRPQWKDAGKTIQAADISPSGKRAIVTARGEVFTVPVDEGSARNISLTPGKREYSGIWSPDGKRVAYISESGTGQVLIVNDQTGMGSLREFPLGPHFYELLAWSRGSKDINGRIVFKDNHLNLFAIELARGAISRIATGLRREQVDVAVSPDGAWLAYTQEQANYYSDLVLFNFDSGERIAASDGSADAAAPAFSRDGQYLYFAASTNSGPLQIGLNMSSQERPYRAGLYALVLAADGVSPLLPDSGDEGADDTDEDNDNGNDSDETGKDVEVAVTRVDAGGLLSRIVALPVAERNYSNLAVADDGKLYYVQSVQPGATNEPPGEDERNDNSLTRFDFDDKQAEQVLTGLDEFVMSGDGKHLLIQKVDGSLTVAGVADELAPETLALDGLKLRVDPRVEWRQIFDEAWRMEKEFFYDPGMHGLDWDAVYERYRPLLEHVGRREDLNRLLVSMIAEMQVGHNRVGGGDIHEAKGSDTGLLGANFAIEKDRYKAIRVYNGESWNPFVDAPLASPGNSMKDGEFILAINGRELPSSDNIFERLQGTVG